MVVVVRYMYNGGCRQERQWLSSGTTVVVVRYNGGCPQKQGRFSSGTYTTMVVVRRYRFNGGCRQVYIYKGYCRQERRWLSTGTMVAFFRYNGGCPQKQGRFPSGTRMTVVVQAFTKDLCAKINNRKCTTHLFSAQKVILQRTQYQLNQHFLATKLAKMRFLVFDFIFLNNYGVFETNTVFQLLSKYNTNLVLIKRLFYFMIR